MTRARKPVLWPGQHFGYEDRNWFHCHPANIPCLLECGTYRVCIDSISICFKLMFKNLVSVQQRSVAIVSFYIVSDSEESPILHQVQSSFYPVEDICAASSSSSEQSCYKNIQMCKMTEWSSLSNDFKSEFPSKN